MGRVHVRRITLQAFRAFQEKQSSPTLPRTGLVGIRGKDLRTGVSSGSGKSTIPLAIAYAFGFCPFPATEQQNVYTAQPMQVELELETDTGLSVIRRGKEFSVTNNGITISSPAREVEKEIVKLTGLPTDLLEALTYRQQKQPGRFLAMTDGEKREFLGTLLGVQEIEAQISAAITTSNKLQVEVDQLQRVVDSMRGTVETTKPLKPVLESVEEYKIHLGKIDDQMEVLHSEEHTLSEKLKAAQEPVARFYRKPKLEYVADTSKRQELFVKVNEAASRVKQLQLAEKSERQKLAEDASAIASLKNKLRDDIVATKKVQEQYNRLTNEIEKLKQSICPTCSRVWDDAKRLLDSKEIEWRAQRELIGQMPQLEALLAQYENQYSDMLAQAQNYSHPMLSKMYECWQNLTIQYEAEKSRLENDAKLFEAQNAADDAKLLEALRKPLQEAQAAYDNFHAELNDIMREQEEVQRRMELVERTNANAMASYESAMRSHEKACAMLKAHELDLRLKGLAMVEEADLAAALKNYLSLLFDEVLAQISAETNELLRSVPNVPTTTITFVSESVTSKGTTKQEIKPVILKNGKQMSLKSGISGGQLESVELAVDLSIAKVIGQRTGVRPGFMIFDESFTAHCIPVKEACMQILQKAAEECLILVVDHSSELKEYFTAYIDIESENDVSRFAIPS